jgi:thymidylate synthase (FAD)
MRHHHSTPFEMCEIKLHVRVPMDCWRQWIRHRTASVNEYSTRYSLAIDNVQTTGATEWRRQATANRQGSDDHLDAEVGTRLSERELQLTALAREIYEERIAADVAREQARKDLPLSTYTEAYWKIDLHNLLHFLRLRMDSHAQDEIRQFATTIGYEIVAKWCPDAWDAFLDYQMDSIALSKIERKILTLLTSGRRDEAIGELETMGLLSRTDRGITRNRERSELEDKLRSFGIDLPWLEK